MLASQILGGLTLGQADMIRKGVAKKKPDLMGRWIELMIYGSEQYKQIQEERIRQYPTKEDIPHDEKGDPICWVDYDEAKPNKDGVTWAGIPEIEGALARGFDLNTLLEIQKQWIAFGNYCFNKAHSACYAKISVITAWLKAYYPTEFMAALLTISEGKKDSKSGDNKQINYMTQTEEMGIQILPTDINKSNADWTPNAEEKTIRYGLSSIAKISTADYELIKKSRPFDSFDIFLDINDTDMKLNKGKVEMLIKSGAFDSLNPNRNLLLRHYYKHRGDNYEQIPKTTSKRTIMEYEKECFGTAITVKSRWDNIEDGTEGIQITGHVTMFEEWTAKTGKTHGRAIIATQEDARPIIVWGYILNRDQNKEKLTIGNKVQLKGKKSKEDLIVSSIKILEGPYLQKYEVDIE